MRKNIYVISNDARPKRYVMNTGKRFDNSLAAETTIHVNQAKDFGSMAMAKSIIARIFNPCERKYKAEKITITVSDKPLTHIDEELS